ncbi:MAG: cyclodeaminase/cyclohydrolase family protein, partial [Traorella sp.]
MLIEKSGLDILDEIDSSSPTPGGGSISALVGTLGICLARMYAHLSVNKKRFLELDETMQDEFKKSFHELKEYKNHLVCCMDD